ncbi:hypothetical protein E1264_17770 [Actinomadura sp. KC216]|uniref:hypothetical protein n=1 Tax=Actinomadura sp. KC216 TaxID=2530370 RepID=UPI00104AD572|nr:hypothetical protein [Actinomadura sp. KC216]TDB86447.1 hypothetical protein E1264_17770 [Actinomadura sp. KC216]
MSTDDRAAFVAGLRELTEFLEAHPDLPLPRPDLSFSVREGDDADERAEVDRIAEILGAEPEETADGGHYTVARSFGPVTYEAVAITSACMARYRALMTYGDAVEPERAAS